MTGVSKDWLVVLTFFVCFFIFTAAETAWINRRTATGFPRSLFVAFGSNIFAITVGYSASFLLIGIVFAAVWDESIDQMTAPSAFLWAAVTAALLVPVLVLAFVKRILLLAAKVDAIESPWLYSILAAFLFNFAVVTATALVAYFALDRWK